MFKELDQVKCEMTEMPLSLNGSRKISEKRRKNYRKWGDDEFDERDWVQVVVKIKYKENPVSVKG